MGLGLEALGRQHRLIYECLIVYIVLVCFSLAKNRNGFGIKFCFCACFNGTR